MIIVYTFFGANESDKCHDLLAVQNKTAPFSRSGPFIRPLAKSIKHPVKGGVLPPGTATRALIKEVNSFNNPKIFLRRNPLIYITQNARDKGIATDGHAGDGGEGFAQELTQLIIVLETGFNGNFL